MRVLFAAKYLHFPQGGGGLERNTHELCLHLIRRGITPAVMCDLQHDFSLLAFTNRLLRKLRPRIRYPMDSRLGYPVFRGWANEDGAREVVSQFKPDIVIAQSAEPVPLIQSFDGMGIPRMAYFHEVEHIEDVNTLIEMGDVGLLANSEFTARKMAERAGFSPAVIRPLIDRSLYLTTTVPKNVLFINTLLKKGVEIAFQLAETRPDVQFDIVKNWNPNAAKYGLAWDTQTLTARARAAGNIILHAPTNDMRRLYCRARLLLAPSQWEEAWGRVATEAQINGIPVLASNRGGLPEAVGPGGILVDYDAPIEKWLDAFSEIWDDESEHARYSAAAHAYGNRPEIQPETVVTTFIDMVKDFISNHSARAQSVMIRSSSSKQE
jgi:glycosyltransferase involved in cell wall biosynthesis